MVRLFFLSSKKERLQFSWLAALALMILSRYFCFPVKDADFPETADGARCNFLQFSNGFIAFLTNKSKEQRFKKLKPENDESIVDKIGKRICGL